MVHCPRKQKPEHKPGERYRMKKKKHGNSTERQGLVAVLCMGMGVWMNICKAKERRIEKGKEIGSIKKVTQMFLSL